MELKTTALNKWHAAQGAKMVPFAGYEMPVQYTAGVMREHVHTRTQAGLFDVSHMGQVLLHGTDAAEKLEQLAPMDFIGLKEGRQRYGFFTNESGGIRDDFMVANRGDHLFIVVNAACKDADTELLKSVLGDAVQPVTDRALVAIQGPAAEAVVGSLVREVVDMRFMDVGIFGSKYGEVWVSRSGYTGEDGYEISVSDDQIENFANDLVADDRLLPIGLGARDSLRLEAGLCLYGNDIDETTTPIEAALPWAIQKARRTGGARAGGFPGADRILAEFGNGTARLRVGLQPEGRAPMREGTVLYADEASEQSVGTVTSGAFGPTVERPVSMAYLDSALADVGSRVFGDVRGKRLPATVASLPFTPANFKR